MISKHAILWVLGIAVITLAVLYTGWDEISGVLTQANPLIMIFLALLQIATLGMTAFQWRYMLNKSNRDLSLGRVLAINLAGNYVESVTPSVKFGGETARLYLFHRQTLLGYDKLAGILLALKYYSLLPFLAFVSVIIGFSIMRYQLPAITLIAFSLLLAFFLLIALMHYRVGSANSEQERVATANTVSDDSRDSGAGGLGIITRKIQEKYQAVLSFVRRASFHSRSMADPSGRKLMLIISAVIWALYPLKVYLVTQTLGLDAGLVTVIIATFTAYLVSMVPLLPGGLGSFEGSMVLVFTLGGLTTAEGLTIALLSRLITYWFPLLLSALAAAYLASSGKGLSGKKVSPFFDISRNLESLAFNWSFFARLYFKLFYQKMLERELEMSGLKPGTRILHIGSGPYPYTGVFLAQRGFYVEAWDCNCKAVTTAKQLINDQGLSNSIKVSCRNGCQLDGQKYDAVWVSLNVSPKEKVLKEAVLSLVQGGVLIYRNLPSWLPGAYTIVPETLWASGYETQSRTSSFGTESIKVKKKAVPVLESQCL